MNFILASLRWYSAYLQLIPEYENFNTVWIRVGWMQDLSSNLRVAA